VKKPEEAPKIIEEKKAETPKVEQSKPEVKKPASKKKWTINKTKKTPE